MRRATGDSADQIKEFKNSLLVFILTVAVLIYFLKGEVDLSEIVAGLVVVVGLLIIYWLVNFLAAPYKIFIEQKSKLNEYEEAMVPKLEISEPVDVVEPKSATGKAFRTWRIIVTNNSATTIKRCCVKKKGLINKSGYLSEIPGLTFKLTTDQPKLLSDYEYQKEFDLLPKNSESIDIACLDENDTSTNARVWMLYAIPNANKSAVRAGLPLNEFPHILTIEISAENVFEPMGISYKLDINDSGLLRMDRIS